MSCSSEAPLGHRVPRLMGWSGSPSTWITCGVTFLALSPIVYIRTPQLTEQYGQVDRVSVARAILSSLSCATAGVRSNPRREMPAPPASALLRKVLRESSILHPPTAWIANLHQKFRPCPKFTQKYSPAARPQSTDGAHQGSPDEAPDLAVCLRRV